MFKPPWRSDRDSVYFFTLKIPALFKTIFRNVPPRIVICSSSIEDTAITSGRLKRQKQYIITIIISIIHSANVTDIRANEFYIQGESKKIALGNNS